MVVGKMKACWEMDVYLKLFKLLKSDVLRARYARKKHARHTAGRAGNWTFWEA